MTSKKMNRVMIGIVSALAVLSIGVTFIGDSLLQKEAQKLVEVKLENMVLESEQEALSRAKSDLERYQELYQITQQIVPSDKDQARATREIVSLAEETGIKIAGISFPASKLGDRPPAPAAAPATGDTGTAPTVPAPPTSSVSQAEPVKGIAGLSQLEITVVSETSSPVSYEQLISFLQKLENNRRTAQVNGLTILPSETDNSLVTFTLTITVYIKS